MKSRCFLFIFIILVFILDFRLVRKLVFLYFNVNVYLKEIPCLNKVTLSYLALYEVPEGYKGEHWVTGNYRGLQEVTVGSRGLQGVTRENSWLQ